MFKNFILFVMAFMMVLPAGAKSVIRSQDEFVHLSDREKDHQIIKTMELIVELEAKYKKDTRKYGFSQKRYETYVKAFQKLADLMIPSAYAAPVKNHRTWEMMAEEFGTLMTRNTKPRCIFGGWVSETAKDPSGKIVCAHPNFILGDRSQLKDFAKETYAYPDPRKGKESGCFKADGTEDRNKIQCSPVIFGYKKASEESLFCVDASDGAHNSSYNCMKLALTDSQPGADSKEDRLKFLREKLGKTSNKALFDNVQGFVYKTCVCPKVPLMGTKTINFSTEYHEYMRPHQTCYGFMEMIAETVDCKDSEPKLPLEDTSIFTSLRTFMKDKTFADENAAGAAYKQFVQADVIRSSAATYNQLCGTNHEGPREEPAKYKCESAACEIPVQMAVGPNVTQEQANTYNAANTTSCTFKVIDEKTNAEVSNGEFTAKEIPANDQVKEITITGKIGGNAVPDMVCPAVTYTKKDLPQEEVVNNDDKIVCVKATCELPALIVAGADDSQDEVNTRNTTTPATCTFELKNERTGEPVTGFSGEPKEAVTSETATQVIISGTVGEKAVTDLTCPTTVTRKAATTPTENDTPKKYKLAVKIKTKGATEYDVEAIITPEGEAPIGDAPGLSWSLKDKPADLTVAEGWNTTTPPGTEETTNRGAAGDSTDEADDNDQAEGGGSPNPPPPNEKSTVIKQKRLAQDYKVCAKLDGDDPQEQCVVIDKIGDSGLPKPSTTPAYNGGGNPNLQSPSQIRGAADTSAVGIK